MYQVFNSPELILFFSFLSPFILLLIGPKKEASKLDLLHFPLWLEYWWWRYLSSQCNSQLLLIIPMVKNILVEKSTHFNKITKYKTENLTNWSNFRHFITTMKIRIHERRRDCDQRLARTMYRNDTEDRVVSYL